MHVHGSFTWQHRETDFCKPTTCPRCNQSVYFVRHNGGSVWFDELGKPWPKHGCFADDCYSGPLHRLLAGHLKTSGGHPFGVVIETETIILGKSGRIVIRCSDGAIIDANFETQQILSHLLGRLVLIVTDNHGKLSLEFFRPGLPRVIAYVQITGNGISEVYPYIRRSYAEKRLSELLALHPNRYQLGIIKRTEF